MTGVQSLISHEFFCFILIGRSKEMKFDALSLMSGENTSH